MSDGAAILMTIVSTAAGSAASWWISRRYYCRSGKDLEDALRPLTGNNQAMLQATSALARMLEQAGIGRAAYDSAGNLTGVTVTASASESMKVTDSIGVEVERGRPPRYDRQHEQPGLEHQGSPDA